MTGVNHIYLPMYNDFNRTLFYKRGWKLMIVIKRILTPIYRVVRFASRNGMKIVGVYQMNKYSHI